ncbi:hypothetical protein AKJ51_01075 [candidate division MSBL1 archaeon SCGC-AAA382A20]|uniref:indole-3-glycerol-phosphate synthase n=1 Tax=candidate division MSBL1 archaeon SCGC-AAA382A20 TaxID=1698280 RepID=A0A133VM70_9EURY|nr:hypothetical protein AKJ51_01075 [candidate division MSBL1 archaeon SCGC-AAA382A20]
MITLDNILENKRKEIEEDKEQESVRQLKRKIDSSPSTKDFSTEIGKQGTNIIAETKIMSPSLNKQSGEGNLEQILELARTYESSKPVAAISVLSDGKYFGGSKEIMQEVRKNTTKPILRKDFIIDEYQIYQSRAYGADAILLISAALKTNEMRKFVDLSRELGMESLVEFSTKEGKKKIPNNVKIYGRNYRHLELNKDLKSPEYDNIKDKDKTLIDDLPSNAIKVAESQIKTRSDIEWLKQEGFDAFLIGTAIATEDDVKGKIEKLGLSSPYSNPGHLLGGRDESGEHHKKVALGGGDRRTPSAIEWADAQP